jgi:hypothetical protein
MFKQAILATVLAVAVVLLATPAQAAVVACRGTESGGTGSRLYYYGVILGPDEALTDVQIGTDDLNLGNYTNFIQPAGWSWSLIYAEDQHAAVKTPHGLVSPPPSGTCPAAVKWSGPVFNGPGTFYFGYDNPNPSHNVSWTVTGEDFAGSPVTSTVDWAFPVGDHGPVHGPVPEPATMGLLALGALALPRRRKRQPR